MTKSDCHQFFGEKERENEMKKTWFYGLLLCFGFVGCVGTSANLNKVSLGMTKAEVIKELGRPDSVSAADNTEYLVYEWATPKQVFADENALQEYFVQVVDGKVKAYGKKGDFDSTKTPESKMTVDLNIAQQKTENE